LLHPDPAVRRERVLDLPLLLVLHRAAEGDRGGGPARRRGRVAHVPADHRADVEAGVRDGRDPVLPHHLGLVPVAGDDDRPAAEAAAAARYRGVPGPAALRLGADLRLRRADGAAGAGRVPAVPALGRPGPGLLGPQGLPPAPARARPTREIDCCMPLALPDRWVWDFWFAHDGDDVHVFYLQAPRALGDPDRRHHNATIG